METDEWLACEDGGAMLRSLRRKTRARKLRLFAVACHRWRAQHTRKFLKVLDALNAAEELADGKGQPQLKSSGWLVLEEDAFEVAVTTSRTLSSVRGKGTVSLSTQASLLRCIVGDPFRSGTIKRNWPASQIRLLAQAAYDERTMPGGHLDPVRLSILADALAEAGCDDTELLGHLRSLGPHVRGCWPVDLVLGKE